jgi:hypothetical protein
MNENVEMRRKDALLLSFFSGTLLITFLVLLGAIFIPTEGKDKLLDWEEIVVTLPIFRFIFMVILLITFVAVDVYILRKFRINYLFIFELDPNYKITHVQLFRVSYNFFLIFSDRDDDAYYIYDMLYWPDIYNKT